MDNMGLYSFSSPCSPMFHPVDDFGVNGLTHGDLWIYPGAKFQMDPDPGKLGKAWAWVV